jgi:hypothetical protein
LVLDPQPWLVGGLDRRSRPFEALDGKLDARPACRRGVAVPAPMTLLDDEGEGEEASAERIKEQARKMPQR